VREQGEMKYLTLSEMATRLHRSAKTFRKYVDEYAPFPKARFNDLTDRRFGRLVVLGYVGVNKRATQWHCLCDCGHDCIIASASLTNGLTQSCGCFHQEQIGNLRRTHGRSRTTVYRTWQGMISRCYNPKNPAFHHYGGRGIGVCSRWKDSFENFLSDMGERPSRNHSIERKNVNGNYAPDNCIWATSREQSRNKRNNKFITINNETLPLIDWCERHGVPYLRTLKRLGRGWNPKDALNIPNQGNRRFHRG
jgi:hypothetical protein